MIEYLSINGLRIEEEEDGAAVTSANAVVVVLSGSCSSRGPISNARE